MDSTLGTPNFKPEKNLVVIVVVVVVVFSGKKSASQRCLSW